MYYNEIIKNRSKERGFSNGKQNYAQPDLLSRSWRNRRNRKRSKGSCFPESICMYRSGNIHKLTIETNDGIFEGRIQLFVHDVDDVRTISTNLRKISEVKTVTRIEKFEDLPN